MIVPCRMMSSFVSLACCCLVLVSSSLTAADSATTNFAHPMNDPQDAASHHILQMVHWLNDMEDGYFNPKIQIRRANPSDPTSYFGVFAAQDLEPDELLMYIPADARIHTIRKKVGDYPEVLCGLAWSLKLEFDKEDRGHFKHYVNYLKVLRRDIIPAVWSQEGKDLLMKVQDELYMKDYEPATAHGSHLVNWIEEWFEKPCLMNPKGTQSLDPYFLAVVTQRGFDNMLVPIYDFFNHHNNNVNIYNDLSIFDDGGFDVYASRSVQAGEELFFSYHNCPDCKECEDCYNSQTYWGTPEMLRDFGFVEPYPHTFYLGDYMTFVISNATLGTKEPALKDLSIEYMDDTYPSLEIFNEAKRELVRLEGVYQNDIMNADTASKIAPHELYTITQYYKALSNAFKVMVMTFDLETSENWEESEAEEEEEWEYWEEEEEEQCANDEEAAIEEELSGEYEEDDEYDYSDNYSDDYEDEYACAGKEMLDSRCESRDKSSLPLLDDRGVIS